MVMKKRLGSMRRSDITRGIDTAREKMQIEREKMDVAADDSDVVTETREHLDLDITEEGAREVETHLEDALGGAEREFHEHDESLEHLQQDAAEQGEEIEAREQSGEDGREKLDAAHLRTELRDVTSGLENASDAMERDLRFLQGETERLKSLEKEFENAQAALRARMQGGRLS